MAFMTALASAIPAWTGTALGVVGTVVQTVGVLNSAAAASAAAEYDAKTQERDAVIADQNRKAMADQNRIAADDARRNNRRAMSSVRAAYGTSGLGMEGSPLDVLEDTAVEQELDTRRTEYEGRVQERSGALQMLGLQEGANLSRREAASARRGAPLAALGTAIGGMSSTLRRVG